MESNLKKPEYTFPMQLGQYTLTKLIGQGGMGEIFLAKDPVCEREVALKRILPDHMKREILRQRFLNEPKIAAQLSHTSIIPVYSLHEEEESIYYTMPYIQGHTLREILVKARTSQEYGQDAHPIVSSIQTLMLIFMNICNALEYTHSKGFLHRDIKPENIMIGQFNEIVILDWGVATRIENATTDESGIKEEDPLPLQGLTKPGKTVGTVEFMAPERALGAASSVKTDIYSLGATLHFILTLQLPFRRPNSLKEWRKQLKEHGTETLTDPQEIAPYREITPQLSHIVLKCMHTDPRKRYESVQEVIEEVKRYIQGYPQWIPSTEFQINKASDWKFQENVLLTKQMAISHYAGVMEWVMLMLSKESYSANIQLSTKVKLKEECSGLGFLMCIPEASERKGLESGYLVWIGSKKHPGCKFLRSNIEIINIDSIYLEPETCYTLSLERQDNVFRLFIDEKLILSYPSHIPLVGGHFGLLFRDTNFDMDPITLSTGSQNVLVKCLSVPDAFLMKKYYTKALEEYRRIAHSFKGRSEGREASFRAGITLIEQGKKTNNSSHYEEALKEFEKLHKTPGAPLEYLGKSLVYRAQSNLDEETKCLEVALRIYSKHPLKHMLEEHVMFRLHETAQKNRRGAYMFTLLTALHLPQIHEKKEVVNLVKNLKASWEPLPFLEAPSSFSNSSIEYLHLALQLSFWLVKPQALYEISQSIPLDCTEHNLLLQNTLVILLMLGYPKLIQYILNVKYKNVRTPEFLKLKNTLEVLMNTSFLQEKFHTSIHPTQIKVLIPFLEKHLTIKHAQSLLPYLKTSSYFEPLYIWALLLEKNTQKALKQLKSKPTRDKTSPYYLLQGCYLALVEGEAASLAHFEDLIEDPFPPTTVLLGHFLKGNITLKSGWMDQAFLWEKLQLYRQLTLFYMCVNQEKKAAFFENMIEEELKASLIPLTFM